ncbi:hypothetical protein B0H13DRAFT_2300375 [Mycena leptocephala]|nr:hypothetical protein B0H13DRAFT_2300375 [Mycena leptocephala]
MSGVKAWHTLHGIPWNMNATEMKILLKAADTLTPPSSKRKPRPPYTVEIMVKLRPHFDLSLPFDASCWSCLTTLFWSTSRAGEFTVKNLQSFNPTLNITRSAVSVIADRNAAFKAVNLDWHQVHGMRIGSTLEYLLRGIPLEVMKSKGCCASDASTLYLRNHAEIMAPYMQADPALHRDVLRIIIPRIR